MRPFFLIAWGIFQQPWIKHGCWGIPQVTIMNSFIFTCLFVLILMSCTHQLPPGKTAKDVAQCHTVCKQHHVICQKTCQNNCMQCHAYAGLKTSNRYCHYAHEQCVKGSTMIRQLNSFRDPLQCAKTTCDCSADYQVCKQSCSGFIHKQLLAPPLSR